MLNLRDSSEQAEPKGLLEVDEALVNDIAQLLAARQKGMVLNLVADLYPVDVAVLLTRLPPEEARLLFEWLPSEAAGDTLAELSDAQRVLVLEGIPTDRLRILLDTLDTDDAADVLHDLPDEQALRVLPTLEDTQELTTLLDYPEDTAGGIMASEFIAVPPAATLQTASDEVRRHADRIDEVYSVFILDEGGYLRGVISLKELLLSPADVEVQSIMSRDVISVPADTDQEEVALIMQRYDLVSLPVVDEEGRMLGRITIDDVIDVIRDEAEEDLQLISGVSGDEEPEHSIFRISRGRMPWLLVGLAGAGLSGSVIGQFEATLEQAVVLAIFIPIVTAMGGNAAVQSAAIAVQGLASGKLWMGDLLNRMGKEMLVALLNGVILAAIVSGVVFLLGLGDVVLLATTVGVTMFTVILLATTNGALVPFLLKYLGIDPASAMGPFVTTLNDIIGLTVYFIYATTLYL